MQYPQLLWLLQLRGGETGAAAGALMQSAGLHKVCPHVVKYEGSL